VREFDHDTSGGCRDVDSVSWSLAGGSYRAKAFAMAIGPRGASPANWARGTGSADAWAELHTGSQTDRFRSHWHDEVTTTGVPADERAKLDHASRINIADERTLERAVGSNLFESRNDGLVSEPITPSAAA
jgi:hypothetical protein